MRVLFTSTPYVGHVNPMVPLARAFIEHGDEVLWATPAEGCPLVPGDITTRPIGQSGDEHPLPAVLARHPEIAALPPSEQPDLAFGKIFGPERASPMLDELLPLIEEWAPTLVVRDAAEFAAPVGASVAGVPWVTHSFGALLPEVRVRNAALDLAELWEAHGLDPRPYGGSYDHLYLDIYPPGMQSQARPHVPSTQHLRTVVPGGVPEPLPDELASLASKPLVYVTLGTVFNDVETLRRVVDGARALDVSVIVTMGSKGDVDALGPQPDDVHVARFIPQEQVLPHCQAVISHAGSGTFLGSLGWGLPQVCVPRGADQFLNARACAEAGCGVTVDPSETAVRDGLASVLSDPSFAIAAQTASREMASMPSPANVAALLAETYGS